MLKCKHVNVLNIPKSVMPVSRAKVIFWRIVNFNNNADSVKL